MGSPFPGMDPYLENRGYWPDFHARFINAASEQIGGILPDAYDARIEEFFRLVAVESDDQSSGRGDVVAMRDTSHPASSGSGGGLATLEPVVVTLPEPLIEEIRETRIQIVRLPDRELVTVVELLSPTNKSGQGRNEYLSKRSDLGAHRVNLVEIDLLVSGTRVPMPAPAPKNDYYVLATRWRPKPICEIYSWSVRQPLPGFRIPLKHPDPDIVFDLPAVFATTYERGRYARLIDYSKPPQTPLPPDDQQWITQAASARR